jgi:hypothetical protein
MLLHFSEGVFHLFGRVPDLSGGNGLRTPPYIDLTWLFVYECSSAGRLLRSTKENAS